MPPPPHEQKIRRFLDETETVLRDVPPAFIFNMDETGINEKADAKNKRVLVHNDFQGRQTQYPITRNREHATVVACIAAEGRRSSRSSSSHTGQHGTH